MSVLISGLGVYPWNPTANSFLAGQQRFSMAIDRKKYLAGLFLKI
jgi:hypothetical protein